MAKLTKQQLDLMKEITQLFAPSGYEHDVAKYLNNYFESLNLNIIHDNLGSIFAFKKSKKANAKKVMICAHMDEIGFMVTFINNDGTIKCTPLGGHTYSALGAQRVILKTKDGLFLNGAINVLPPHLSSFSSSQTSISDLIFDFGFNSAKQAIDNGVYIGAPIILKGEFEILNDGQRLLSKAFDDRYGIILIVDILKELINVELPFDLYIGGTVQEEVGLRGAQTAANLINPDLAIVLDCSPSKDVLPGKELGQIGQGVLLRFYDRSMIAFPELIDLQIKACQETGAKYQFFQSPGSTDAGVVHKSGDGVLTLTHCVCARSIHSASTILDVDDYLDARKSLMYLLLHLDGKTITSLKEKRQ